MHDLLKLRQLYKGDDESRSSQSLKSQQFLWITTREHTLPSPDNMIDYRINIFVDSSVCTSISSFISAAEPLFPVAWKKT